MEEVRSQLFGPGPPHLSSAGLTSAFTLMWPVSLEASFHGSSQMHTWRPPFLHVPWATLHQLVVQGVLRTKALPGNQDWSQGTTDRIRNVK